MNPLDRPIWSALTTRHAEFAQGGPLALRYRSTVEPFAATERDDESALAALPALVEPGDFLLLLQATPSPVPPGMKLVHDRLGVQMIATRPIDGDKPDDAVPLGDSDVAEMIALAELTKPGPFRSETHRLAQFWGIRRDGRLIAMAGERMKLPGMSELSGICSHPDWRGHGFARSLSAFVCNLIQQRGETPILHAYADNAGAIRLYEELGFELRSEMAVQAFAVA
jgi:ribosomal protein S18 acetylase RimI-like enzyme